MTWQTLRLYIQEIIFKNRRMQNDGDMKGQSPMDQGRDRSRSRSPVRRSRSRSRSPRDWKRERGSKHDRNDEDRPVINSKRVYVSNIPYEIRWQDLKDLFKNEVGEVAYVELVETPDGKSTGSGIVEFKDKDAAQKAADHMHRFDIKGRKIVVREERESDRRRLQRMKDNTKGNHMGGGDSGNMGGNMGNSMGNNMGNMGNMGGGTSTFSNLFQQLNIDGPLTNQVFVANLDYKVNERKLRDIFKMAGNVRVAELKVDKEGNSRGMGIVRFDHPMEAVQAISMFNGQILYERAMSVRMDKMSDTTSQQTMPNKLPSGLKTIGMGLGASGAPLQNISQLSTINMMNALTSGGIGGNNMGNMGGNMGNNMGGSMAGNMGNMGAGMGNMGGGMGNMGGGMGNMGGGMGNMGTGMGNMGNMGTGMGNMGTGMGNMGSMGGSFGDMGMGSSNMSSGLGLGNLSSNLSQMNNMTSMGMGNMGMGSMDSMSSMGSRDTSNFMTSMMGNSANSSTGRTGSRTGTGGGTTSRGRDDEVNSVYVRNIPYSYTWQNLKERFRHIGEVRFAAIKTEGGKSKGCGVVRFSSQDQARRAVNQMNGVRIEGREIEVSLMGSR